MSDDRIKVLGENGTDKMASYQKKWESLLENITYCDSGIKHSTNVLLLDAHMVAISKNSQKGLFFENMGFSTDDGYYEDADKCNIPMLLQIKVFELIRCFTSLAFYSMEIMNLLGDIDLFLNRVFPNDNLSLREGLQKELSMIPEAINELKNSLENLQQREEKTGRKIDKFIREENYNRLTQKECSIILHTCSCFYINERNTTIEKKQVKSYESKKNQKKKAYYEKFNTGTIISIAIKVSILKIIAAESQLNNLQNG